MYQGFNTQPVSSYSGKETIKFESTDSEFSFSSEVNVESDTDTSDSTSSDSFTDTKFSDSEWSDDSESGNINNNTKSLAVEEPIACLSNSFSWNNVFL